MFAVNIVRVVGWIIIVVLGIPSAALLAFTGGEILRDPSNLGAGLTLIAAVVATFLFSATSGALLVAFAQVVETLKVSEESLRSIETNARRTSSRLEQLVKAVDPGASMAEEQDGPSSQRPGASQKADSGFGTRHLPSDHPVRRKLEEDD